MAITNQFNMKQGLRIVDDALHPSSKGIVSDQGMHVPDLDIIDGKNTLPTIAGYTSFFGTERTIDNTALGSTKIQEILTFRTEHYDTIQLAFTSDGLYLSSSAGSATATREYANENLSDTTDDLSGGPETITIDTTGSYTLSVYGTAAVTVAAGTATGTGFGQATEGSDITFNITSIGTVTLTLDSGVFKIIRGAVGKKVEVGTAATTILTTPESNTIIIDLPGGKGNWIKVLWANVGHANPFELWTYALIENDFYIYHKGLKHIYRMYSIQSEQVRFEEKDPSYIISNDKLWYFTITAEDDSDGDDTYKAVEINTDSSLYLGNYSHPVEKAHQVWNAERLVLAPFHAGLNASVENLVRAKVDIDATIPLTGATVEVHHNGEASELITTVASYDLVESPGLGGYLIDTEITDFVLGGTFTFSWTDYVDAYDYHFDTSSYTSIYTMLEALLPWLQSTIPYGAWTFKYIVDVVSATQYDLTLNMGTNSPGFYSISCTYTGGYSTLSTNYVDGGFAFYEPNARMAIAAVLSESIAYPTFVAGSEVWFKFNGVKYSVFAMDGETASSIIARLYAVIVAEDPFSVIGPLNFILANTTDYVLGGPVNCPFTFSSNINAEVTFGPLIYAQGYNLRIQGFKEYGLTELSVRLGDTYYSIPVSSVDDSNDIATKIYNTINTAGWASDTMTVTTAASATADYSLVIQVPIFDGSTPSASLDQDGTTLWAIDGSGYGSETVELLQVDGIYEARGRIGYWTYNNTLGWSAFNDPVDFVPSTVTRANQISVKAIKGDIVKCIGYENGFIIYAEGNVVYASYTPNSQNTFEFKVLESAPGLIDPRHLASTLGIHYYWHTSGLYAIDSASGRLQEQLEDIGDWILKYKYPITVQSLGNRFLVLNLLESYVGFTNRKERNGEVTIQGYRDAFTGSPVEFERELQGRNLYPVYKRALVYDAKLGKWGSCDQDYRVLASLMPYNQSGHQIDKDYSNTSKFLDAHQKGLLIHSTDDKLYVCNDDPDDSYISFGAYRVHRLHRTKVVSSNLEFVDYPLATMDFEPSLDEYSIDWDRVISKDARLPKCAVYPNASAYWFVFTLRGRYHVKRGLVKGHKHGR